MMASFIADNVDSFRMLVEIVLEDFDPQTDVVNDIDTQSNFGGQTLPNYQDIPNGKIYVAARFGDDIFVRTNVDDRLYLINWGKIVKTDPVSTFAYFNSIV